jgi:hypothetical protein
MKRVKLLFGFAGLDPALGEMPGIFFASEEPFLEKPQVLDVYPAILN